LFYAAAARAQGHLPVSKELWGESSENIEAWILQEPGFMRASDKSTGNTRIVTYDRVQAGTEALGYRFENDSLVQVTRMAFAAREKECGPWPDWEKVGVNEWLVNTENVWIRRVYDGRFIRDTFRKIK
jgi:hypothetical protein